MLAIRRRIGDIMAKAKKLPSGNWRVQAKITINGKQYISSFTDTSPEKAERAAEAWQNELKKIGSDTSQMTVRRAMQEYIELYKKDLSPSTLREYKRILSSDSPNDLKDLKDKRLNTLNSLIIKQSMNNSTLSPKTIKNRYSFLQTVLKTYYPQFVWNVKYPKQIRRPKPEYNIDMIRNIQAAVADSHIELEVYLGMLSLRASEIAGLQWQDINYDKQYFDILRVKVIGENNKPTIKECAKTELSMRRVYFPNKVKELLLQRQNTSQSEFVSTVAPNQMWLRFNRRLKMFNLPPLAFHKLRHIYSSLSAYLGINSAVRMENGGWSNQQIMDGTYRHTMTEAQVSANEKMNDFFNR